MQSDPQVTDDAPASPGADLESPNTADPALAASTASDATPSRRSRAWWAAAITLGWLCVLIGAIFFSAALWVRRTFGAVSVDQFLTNLTGIGGDGGGGDLIGEAVWAIFVIPTIIVVIGAMLVEKSRRVLRRHDVLAGRRSFLFRAVATLLVISVPLFGTMTLSQTLGIQQYFSAVMTERATGISLADYYMAPETGIDAANLGSRGMSAGDAGSGDTERTNLVLIYLESIEDQMADDTLFEKNMLASVQDATSGPGWTSLPKLQQYEGGGWTMSGIVSTQCGIPLRTASSLADATELNSFGAEDGEDAASYLPGARCLGDVLADEGYTNVYLGGADAAFAGKGTFLSGHGYDEINDLSVWRDAGETEVREDWGLSDRRLIDQAKSTVTRLHDAGEPFNLTLLTLDTHEAPRVYEYCDWDTEVAMTSITVCSMEQVAELVDYMSDRGYLDDTTVVLMGDHRKMVAEGGSFWDELHDLDAAERTIFNRIWAPDCLTFARDEIDQFSMYPTILEAMGIELADHRAGLGVSALASDAEVPAGSMLDLDSDAYSAIVNSRSVDFFTQMWGVTGHATGAADDAAQTADAALVARMTGAASGAHTERE